MERRQTSQQVGIEAEGPDTDLKVKVDLDEWLPQKAQPYSVRPPLHRGCVRNTQSGHSMTQVARVLLIESGCGAES